MRLGNETQRQGLPPRQERGVWGWSFYAPLGKYTGVGRCCSKACGLWGNIMSALITFCHVDNVEVLSPLPLPPLLPVRRVFCRKCRQKGKTSDWKTPPDIIATYSITQPNRAMPGRHCDMAMRARIFHSKLCLWQAQKDSTRTQRTLRADKMSPLMLTTCRRGCGPH